MIYFNSEYPKILNEHARTYYFKKIINNKFLVLYDWNNLIVYNLHNNTKIFHSNIFNINLAWKNNFDINVKSNYIAINYRTQINQYSYNNYFKVWRIDDSGLALIKDLHYQDNRNFDNGNDFHEMNSKVLSFDNGFAFLRFTGERWDMGDRREDWCDDYQAIKPLRDNGARFDKIFGRLITVNFNGTVKEHLMDLGKVVGELIECSAGGDNRHRRIRHIKKINNLYISNNLISNEGYESNQFFICYSLSYRQSLGKYRKHRRRYRRTCRHWDGVIPEAHYNTECGGVFGINGSGDLYYKNDLTQLSTIANENALPGNSMFENFRSNTFQYKFYSAYNSTNEIALLKFNNNQKAMKIHFDFSNRKIDRMDYNLSDFNGNIDNIQINFVNILGNQMLCIYDYNNSLSINSTDFHMFKNKSTNVFKKATDICFAITNDSYTNNNDFKMQYFDGNILLANHGNSMKLFYLEDYEYHFKNNQSFGMPTGIEKTDKYLYATFNYSYKKFPIIFLRNTTNIIASDFPIQSTIKIFELINIISHYNGNKNIYFYNQYPSKVLMYDLNSETNLFKNGNIYSFNIEHRVFNLNKTNSFNSYFELKPVYELENKNINYCSNQVSFKSDIQNYNQNFYIYLFSKNNELISDSGINYLNNNKPVPNDLIRNSFNLNVIDFNLIGLKPNSEYKLIVIPYSNSTDKTTFLNKTFEQILNSNIPKTLLNFKTNIVPVLDYEYVEKINNLYKIKIKDFNEDQFSSLKYTLINKNKIWDSNKFEIINFVNEDIFEKDFLDRNLIDHKNYLTLNSDKTIEIKNVYYDENYIVLINHFDKFKNSFIYKPDNSNVGIENYYLPIPFNYQQMKDSNLNFIKKGLSKELINQIKFNYADFKETSYNVGFDFVTFDIPNFKFNQEIINNYGENKKVTYQLNEILYYKVHMIQLPFEDSYTIPEKYTPSFKYYYSFNISMNSKENFSSYTKKLLEAGQVYSYYIEPIFYQDRNNLEMMQMIWDKIKTPNKSNHLQNTFTTKAFNYLDSDTILIKEIENNNIKLNVPTFEDVLNANPDIEIDLVSTLDLRMQVFEKHTNKRKIVKFFKKENFGELIELNNLMYSQEYYITFNSCLNSTDSFNTLIEENKKKNFITYPKEISNYEFDYNSYVLENNNINFNFHFKDLTDISCKIYKLDTLQKNKILLNNISITKNENIFTIKIINDNKQKTFDEIYLFEFYRTKFNLNSKTNNYLLGLPMWFENQIFNLKEKFVDSLTFDLINLSSLKHKTFTTNTKMYLNKKNLNQIDYQLFIKPKDCIKDPSILNDIKAHNLTPGVIYEIMFKSFFDNQEIIDLNFPQYLKDRKKFPNFEQGLVGLEIQMDPGKLVNININRFENEGLYDLEYTFNYYGISCQAKIGTTLDGNNLNLNKPFVWHKLNNTNSLSQYYGIIKNVGSDEINFFIEFYHENKITKIENMNVEEFPKLKGLPRLNMTIYKEQQVYNKGNYTTNSMAFEGVLSPPEADFKINCISIEEGFQPNITFTSYLDKDENGENIKRFKFLLNDLEYGYHYSKFKKIQVIAEPTNKNKYLDSYVYDLNDFKLKYPLLNGVKSNENINDIKSDLDFKFEKVLNASFYIIQIYYKDINEEAYRNEIILTDKIRNNPSYDEIIYQVPKEFIIGSGYYKARITTLNADYEPSDYNENDYSSSYIEVLYFSDKIKMPKLITQVTTSELQPIINWDFKDEILLTTDDKKPNMLLYTNDFNISNNKDSNMWYGTDLDFYNLKTLPFKLSEGLNKIYFKTFNKKTNRYSNVEELNIEYKTNNEFVIPNNFYINDFYGINSDGINENYDYKRLINLPKEYKINKLEYVIKNSNNETVSVPIENKTIYIGTPFINNFYIYLDYLDKQLKDGDYLIEFYNFDKNGFEKQLFKTSRLKIKTLNISSPKIKINSQIVI